MVEVLKVSGQLLRH